MQEYFNSTLQKNRHLLSETANSSSMIARPRINQDIFDNLSFKEILGILIWFTNTKNLTLWKYNKVFASIKITFFIPNLQRYSLKLLIRQVNELFSIYEKKVLQYGSPERIPVYESMGHNLPVFIYFYKAFKLSRVASWVLDANSSESDTVDSNTGIRNITAYEYFFPKDKNSNLKQIKKSFLFSKNDSAECAKEYCSSNDYSQENIYIDTNPIMYNFESSPNIHKFLTNITNCEPQNISEPLLFNSKIKPEENPQNTVDQKVKRFMYYNQHGHNNYQKPETLINIKKCCAEDSNNDVFCIDNENLSQKYGTSTMYPLTFAHQNYFRYSSSSPKKNYALAKNYSDTIDANRIIKSQEVSKVRKKRTFSEYQIFDNVLNCNELKRNKFTYYTKGLIEIPLKDVNLSKENKNQQQV
ncbi:hypothetical protein BB561_005639 [Smittium simulii]|uniref:Uncharacterized protein n=1 Tax=Smittium simulii TaxID=133385 RepID=A0A2T9Y9F2_9FUNG|nr:hypothetical protein BB561_005639 [Smittium simulii]